MTYEEKKALADQIRQKASELNELVKTATDAEPTVDLTVPDIYSRMVFDKQPTIQVKIREIKTTIL